MTTLASGPLRQWSIAFVTGVAVAVICGAIAHDGKVSAPEADVFHAVNDLPGWLRPIMWVFQLAGLLFVPFAVAVVAAAFRRWRLTIALVVLVPLKLLVEKAIVKQIVERERPGTTICGYPNEFDPTCGHFRGVPLDGLSFVSGHAIISWSVATLLWPVLPGKWRWAPVVAATLNAVARVYLGAHNPLDVVGGAAIGIALGSVLVVALRVDPRLTPRGAISSAAAR